MGRTKYGQVMFDKVSSIPLYGLIQRIMAVASCCTHGATG